MVKRAYNMSLRNFNKMTFFILVKHSGKKKNGFSFELEEGKIRLKFRKIFYIIDKNFFGSNDNLK